MDSIYAESTVCSASFATTMVLYFSYLDKYRDKKEINEQVLKEKLKITSPFKPQPPKPKYPNIFHQENHVPFWYKEEQTAKRFREGKYKGLEEGQ